MEPQKNTRRMLPQVSRSAMLIYVLDPRRQKEKLNPRRKPGKKPTIINMPHDPDAPIRSIELSSGCPIATQSCSDDTQCLPPMRSPTPLFVNGAYCLVTGIKIQPGTAADILFMHLLRKGSLLSSDREELNQSASTILMSWMFSRNLLRLSSVQTRTGGRKR